MSKSKGVHATSHEGKSVIQYSEQEADCPILPSPEALEHYQRIDPALIEWFKNNTIEESKSRRKYMFRNLHLAFLSNIVGYAISTGLIVSTIIMLVKEQYVGASATGIITAVAFAVSLLGKRK